jgi:hypothetical protein
MNPPTEQLIRDYLNRVSVAARGRLSAEDRRAFLARTREFIEQNTRALGHTDSTDVLKLLAGLGDPAVLVDRERDRLAGQRAGSGADEPASDARSTRAWRWRPGRGALADLMTARATAVPPGQEVHVPEPAQDVPLTGELQFQTRPVTSRWRPGAPMVPKPPRQRRAGIPRRLQPGGLPPDSPDPGNAQEHPPAGEQPAGAADQQSAGSPPVPPVPPLPADARPRGRRPEWPLLAARRPDTGGTAGANGQSPVGDGALPNGQAQPSGAQPSGAQPSGAQPNGTMPKGRPPGAVPAQRTPVDGPQPGPQPGAPAGSSAGGELPAGQQPSETPSHPTNAGPVGSGAPNINGTATAGAPPAGMPPAGGAPGGAASASGSGAAADDGSSNSKPPADVPASDLPAGGVSSSDLVAGKAPGNRRLAAVARGAGWASGVRARGARVVGARGAGRSAGAPARSGRGSNAGHGESAGQPGSQSAEEQLSGLWPDLGPIGAGAGRLARTVLARARRRPLEATAVVLLGLGGLIYPPVWLMGAALALVSRVWDIRDKWVGLVVPVFLVIVGMVADVSLGGTRSGVSGYAKEAWIFGSHISRLAAVLGAVYLVWRAERGRRSPQVAPWNKPRRFG